MLSLFLALFGFAAFATVNEAPLVTEIVFNKGSSELSADGKSQLRDILTAAQSKGKIDEVKILSWADSAYPAKGRIGQDASKLADERNQEIEGYIDDQLKDVDVDNHNMSEQPTAVEKLLKTEDARVKRSLEVAGLVPDQKNGAKLKASRALVMVLME